DERPRETAHADTSVDSAIIRDPAAEGESNPREGTRMLRRRSGKSLSPGMASAAAVRDGENDDLNRSHFVVNQVIETMDREYPDLATVWHATGGSKGVRGRKNTLDRRRHFRDEVIAQTGLLGLVPVGGVVEFHPGVG